MQTEFSRWKKLLAIAWPLIIANSFWNLQLTIDRIYLGMYSTEALGAAMAVMGVFWVPMALLQQTAAYVTTFVAQYYGANEKDKIGQCFWQAIHVSWIGGLAVLGLIFVSPLIFSFIGHEATLQKLEIEYFNSMTFAALPTALVAAISGFFTGKGDTKTVASVNMVGLILNSILAYVMVFGKFGFPEMGVTGAGYATAIATYGAAIYGFALIFRKKYEDEFKMLSRWRINPSMLKQFLKFGLPSGAQWALEGLAFTVFLMIMGRLANGPAALSSSSIAVTVMMLSVLPTMGVAQAVLTLVGQRLGEGKPELAVQTTWDGVKVSAIYILCVATSFYVIPDFYLSWFKNEGNAILWSQVSQLAPILLQIVGIFTLFDSMYLNISFALKGAGDTRFVSIVALAVPWPLMVLPAYLVKDWENAAIWAWGFCALYAMVITMILVTRFRGGKWKNMSVIHPTT